MSTSPINNSTSHALRSKAVRIPSGTNSEETAVTVKDIANHAGVSVATVSRVTNGSGSVSRETRDRVLSAISKLRYRPNASAAQLARRSNGVSRNGGPRHHQVSAVPLPAGLSRTDETERLLRLERENLLLKRQLSILASDLARWKQSSQPDSES